VGLPLPVSLFLWNRGGLVNGSKQSPNLSYSKGVGSPVAALPLAVSSWSGRSLWSVEWELHKISL
jgi:hypothetical protein